MNKTNLNFTWCLRYIRHSIYSMFLFSDINLPDTICVFTFHLQNTAGIIIIITIINIERILLDGKSGW